MSAGPRYAFIPGAAVDDPGLTPTAFRVLCYLGRHTNNGGWCRIKQKTMAAEMGIARSTVQVSLDLLYRRGWVEKRLEGWKGVDPDPDGQPFAAHSYRVVIEREAPLNRPKGNRLTDDAEGVADVGEDGAGSAQVPDGSGTGGALSRSGTRCPASSGTYKRSSSNERTTPPVGPPHACGQIGADADGGVRDSARKGLGRGDGGESEANAIARAPPREEAR